MSLALDQPVILIAFASLLVASLELYILTLISLVASRWIHHRAIDPLLRATRRLAHHERPAPDLSAHRLVLIQHAVAYAAAKHHNGFTSITLLSCTAPISLLAAVLHPTLASLILAVLVIPLLVTGAAGAFIIVHNEALSHANSAVRALPRINPLYYRTNYRHRLRFLLTLGAFVPLIPALYILAFPFRPSVLFLTPIMGIAAGIVFYRLGPHLLRLSEATARPLADFTYLSARLYYLLTPAETAFDRLLYHAKFQRHMRRNRRQYKVLIGRVDKMAHDINHGYPSDGRDMTGRIILLKPILSRLKPFAEFRSALSPAWRSAFTEYVMTALLLGGIQ